MQTPYSINGSVRWWYHVSTVVNYMNSIYVLDPAVNAEGPILIEEWYNTIGITDEMEAVVCNPYTYDPFDRCYDATDKSDKALKDQLRYLEKEWDRMEFLGFDPIILLGNNPPWIVQLLSTQLKINS
nr:protein-glutamine glutaminase family protein [Legionella norrlandica]